MALDEDSAMRLAFASRLNAAIKRRELSHRQLAEQTGTSKQSVTNWTQGRHEPGLPQVRQLAAALGVSVAYLVGEVDAPKAGSLPADTLAERLVRLKLKDPLRSLSESGPDLLQLLDEAERLARRRLS
ncbi:MAG TPA: helix-turn-helix transcriptional regulator [Solirubrobacterales bacterium]|nr:helix-turn-helix transcriptional regulator [Solirubrobacterales bacterium]